MRRSSGYSEGMRVVCGSGAVVGTDRDVPEGAIVVVLCRSLMSEIVAYFMLIRESSKSGYELLAS